MSENIQQLAGRPSNYKFDRGGNPTEMGPFIGTVTNSVDPTRAGRLQVRIEQFASVAEGQGGLRWVNYLPPFYGVTQKPLLGLPSDTPGNYPNNQQSYGMWFTPPDVGTRVLCFFVEGDPSQGYYLGCVIEESLTHMLPAIGAAKEYATQNKTQAAYFSNSTQLPVTEVNTDNPDINNNPKFFNQPKPVHNYQAAIFLQQGLDRDTERGPIISNAQRESPSTVYGISTPGQPIYSAGLTSSNIQQKLAAGTVTPEQAKVTGRLGGHTFVMDDGDLDNKNALIRLRTTKGHQLMMNDSENFFYIVHANGQTWIELGAEGTVDVYSTNSVNVRTEGTINLHADKDINMFAGRNINMKSNAATHIGAVTTMQIASQGSMTLYSEKVIGVLSDGTLAMQSTSGSWNSGSTMKLNAGRIDLNGGAGIQVPKPRLYPTTKMPDTTFNSRTGWQIQDQGLESIVTRAPTHEPYPYHNQGVPNTVSLSDGPPAPLPEATPVPTDWSIIRKA